MERKQVSERHSITRDSDVGSSSSPSLSCRISSGPGNGRGEYKREDRDVSGHTIEPLSVILSIMGQQLIVYSWRASLIVSTGDTTRPLQPRPLEDLEVPYPAQQVHDKEPAGHDTKRPSYALRFLSVADRQT
jgi:hypothetical protein